MDKEKIMEELNLTWNEELSSFVDAEVNTVLLETIVEQLKARGAYNLDVTLQDHDIAAVNVTAADVEAAQANTLPEPAYSQVSRAKSAFSRGGNRQNRKLKSKTLKKKEKERDLESQVT